MNNYRIIYIVVGILISATFYSCLEGNRQKKILILGNSITQQGPSPQEKWFGMWGMAATDSTKDYVHVLISKLRSANPDIHYQYKAINIAYWERNFDYDFSKEANMIGLENYHPDRVLIRLGENVPHDSLKNYERALVKLIQKFGANSQVLITSNFWPHHLKDSIQAKVASSNEFIFIDLSSLANDDRNKALNEYPGSGVGQHPSDFGVENIANKIFEKWK